MKTHRNFLIAVTVTLGFALPDLVRAREESGEELFEKAIRPVLVEKCYSCHSSASKSPKGGLRLDSISAIRKGGTSGEAVVPGKPEESLLIDAIAHAEGVSVMPPSGKLPERTIADFR
ncbi:c-type cytochrome domain-containing protein, partial [Singulisphaera rosea]